MLDNSIKGMWQHGVQPTTTMSMLRQTISTLLYGQKLNKNQKLALCDKQYNFKWTKNTIVLCDAAKWIMAKILSQVCQWELIDFDEPVRLKCWQKSVSQAVEQQNNAILRQRPWSIPLYVNFSHYVQRSYQLVPIARSLLCN